MKKSTQCIVLVLVLVLGFAGSVNVSKAQSVSFGSNLYYGLKSNSDVQALQEFLSVQGDYSGPITGNFFSFTFQGVKKFQREHGVPPTGYFGVLSRRVANNLLAAGTPQPSQDELGTTTQSNTTTPDVSASSSQPLPPQSITTPAPSQNTPTPATNTTQTPQVAAAPQPPTCTLTATIKEIDPMAQPFPRWDVTLTPFYDGGLYGNVDHGAGPSFNRSRVVTQFTGFYNATTTYIMTVVDPGTGLTNTCSADVYVPNN